MLGQIRGVKLAFPLKAQPRGIYSQAGTGNPQPDTFFAGHAQNDEGKVCSSLDSCLFTPGRAIFRIAIWSKNAFERPVFSGRIRRNSQLFTTPPEVYFEDLPRSTLQRLVSLTVTGPGWPRWFPRDLADAEIGLAGASGRSPVDAVRVSPHPRQHLRST